MSDFTLYNMDVLKALQQIKPESVDCVITSPPYWGLRDYGIEGQIGLEEHPQQYIDKMVEVFAAVKKVLKPTGSLWLNLGDSYCSHRDWTYSDMEGKQNYAEGQKFNPKFKENWLQPKQKMLMPHRTAIALQENGWILRNDICWHKPSHMPSSVKDRLTNSFEYVFHFVKQKRYYYDLDAIREPHTCKENRPQGIIRQKTYEESAYNKSNDPKLAQYKYNNKDAELMASPRARASRGDFDESKFYNPSGKNPGDTWKYGDTENETKHRQGFFRGREFDEVETRPLLPTQKEFVEKIRKEFYVDEIVEMTGLKKTMVEHWFRKDESGFAFPSKEDWETVMEMMKTNLFWKELTYNETKPALVEANPSGKNPGDFWAINPKPYPEAHFACFPPALVEKPLKATCPKQVCLKCGFIKERITEKEYISAGGKGENEKYDTNNQSGGLETGSCKPQSMKHGRANLNIKTLGWTSCKCNAEFQPGTVLDPFVGSGTTLLVSQELGLKGIGIEINPEYIPLIKKRLLGDQHQTSLNPNKIEVIK